MMDCKRMVRESWMTLHSYAQDDSVFSVYPESRSNLDQKRMDLSMSFAIREG
jgi:hypothetical protein